jgi:DNA-binding LytR/AlgR family response regulator
MYADIAILDDNREDSLQIQDMIFNIQGNWHVDQYTEGKKLIEAVESGKNYDLLLLDIYLKSESGIEVAKELQRMIPEAPVVFITISQEHAVEAYSMGALHYIVKPIRQEDMVEIFRRLNHRSEPRHVLAIQVDRSLNVLFQDEIIRVESHGHSTTITCTGGTAYSIWKTYREIVELLDDTFISIKKGVTLNMRYISRMTNRDCTTRDGRTYLLRRDQAKEFRERYFSFVEAELKKK